MVPWEHSNGPFPSIPPYHHTILPQNPLSTHHPASTAPCVPLFCLLLAPFYLLRVTRLLSADVRVIRFIPSSAAGAAALVEDELYALSAVAVVPQLAPSFPLPRATALAD